MVNTLSYFHFLRPWYLLLLLPLAYLLWKLWHNARSKNSWANICDPNLLPYLLQNRATVRTHLPLICLAMAWLITTLTLAGPTWSQLIQPVYRSSMGNVIVLDVSPAMLAVDIKPNRFVRAKYKLLDLLNLSLDGSLGLVVYSGEAYSVAPLTNDAKTLINLANTVDPSIMPVSGNNLSQGLKLAAKLLQQAQASPALITVITGSMPDAMAINIASELVKQNIYVNVLGIGTAQGAPSVLADGNFVKDNNGNLALSKLDSGALLKLSQAGGGRYVAFSETDQDVNELLKDIHVTQAARKLINNTKLAQWQDRGQYLLFLLIPFALLVFRRGWWEEV